jgi:hypothetical protein
MIVKLIEFFKHDKVLSVKDPSLMPERAPLSTNPHLWQVVESISRKFRALLQQIVAHFHLEETGLCK